MSTFMTCLMGCGENPYPWWQQQCKYCSLAYRICSPLRERVMSTICRAFFHDLSQRLTDDYDRYIVLSFTNATMVLEVRDSSGGNSERVAP